MSSNLGYESEKVLEADSLIKICTTLNCSFDDIVEIINNEE